jgi:3-hydroxyisobutyrate dehydrogenase
MGSPMTKNIIKSEFDTVVFDVSESAVSELVALGATAAASPRALAEQVDVVITMLPGPVQVREVIAGPGGVLEGLRAGATWIDMSTSSPGLGRELAPKIADKKIGQLDAPVSGMAKGAIAGTLQIFVGGDEALYQTMRPVLESMGDPARIFRVGPVGAGHTVKLILNLLWFEHAVAAAEAFVMGSLAGIEIDVLQRALVASPANSNFIQHDINSVFVGDYDESFAMRLVCKDLGLAVDMGRDLGVPVEMAALTEQIHRRALREYGENGGEMLAVKLYEDLMGIELRAER